MNCLNTAIGEERIHQVRLLLSLNVNTSYNDKSDKNRTPLIKACRIPCKDTSVKMAKILLAADSNVNYVDDDERCALHYVCENGNSRLVKLIVSEDAVSLNKIDKEGNTPLMLAAREGNWKCARLMLNVLKKFNLDVDLKDKEGYTALLIAIKNKNYEIACDLLQYGNACTTIRENENFRNAHDWLRTNLVNDSNQRKAEAEKEAAKQRKRRKSAAAFATGNNENDDRGITARTNATTPYSTVPVLKIGSSHRYTGDLDSISTYTGVKSTTGRTSHFEDAVAKSGLLFEPNPFGKSARPSSATPSQTSLRSNASTEGKSILKDRSLSELNGSTPKTTHRTITDGSFPTSRIDTRRSTMSNRKEPDLLKTSLLRSKLRSQQSQAESFKNDITFREDLTKSRNISSALSMTAISNKDRSENDMSAIHRLKNALKEVKDQQLRRSKEKGGKYTRPSTAVSSVSSLGSSFYSRPRTRAQAESGRSFEFSNLGRLESTYRGDDVFDQLRRTDSIQSMDSLITKSEISTASFVNNYKDKSAIEKAKRNLQTLFSLYTDSLLWTATAKPAVIETPEIAKTTNGSITNETDINDLNSLLDNRSIAETEATTKSRKTDKKSNRLSVGSAATSRKSASGRWKSAGSVVSSVTSSKRAR